MTITPCVRKLVECYHRYQLPVLRSDSPRDVLVWMLAELTTRLRLDGKLTEDEAHLLALWTTTMPSATIIDAIREGKPSNGHCGTVGN